MFPALTSYVVRTAGCRGRVRDGFVPRAGGIRTSGEHVVKIKSSWKKRYKINNSEAIPIYNANAQDYLQNLDLPLGAELVAVDTNSGAWKMEVPKLEFSDVFIKYVVNMGAAYTRPSQHILFWYTCFRWSKPPMHAGQLPISMLLLVRNQ